MYLLVSLVIIGATRDGGPIWQVLGQWGEGAVVKAAAGFMPFGIFLMLIGGLLANLGALNATIYSCSRVAFALARDRNVWSRLANIHLKNLSPHLAVIASTILIALMVIFLPLIDIAALASLLFILLFLQLNIAGINIHYKWPDTKWAYKVPLFPITPLVAVGAYALLAITMLKVNLSAWIVSLFWVLLGFVNYFAYAKTQSRESFETGIVYEQAARIGPKTGRRILLPLSPELNWEQIKNLSEIAFTLASKFNGELIIVRIHEIPPALALHPSVIDPKVLDGEKKLFESLQQWVNEYNVKTGPEKKDINFHSLILIGRDVVDVILDVIKQEDCDLLLLNWEGYPQTQGVILSAKIDRILRESQCDLVVIKNPRPIKSVLLAAHPSAKSPYLELMGEVVSGLNDYYKPTMKLFSVIDSTIPSYLKLDPTNILKGLRLKKKDFADIKIVTGKSVANSILEESEKNNIDLIVIGATVLKFLQEIRFGGIAESLIRRGRNSVMVVRSHQGATEVLIKKVIRSLSKKDINLT